MINTLTMVRQLKKKFPHHHHVTITSEHSMYEDKNVYTTYTIEIIGMYSLSIIDIDTYADLVEKVKSIISDPDNKILKEI